MKLNNKWLWALLPAAILSSCAEDKFDSYSIPEPASLAETKFLAEYKVLKDYNVGVPLGAVVDVSEYTSKGLVYGLTSTNFDEVTAGKKFMHGALVKNAGNVNVGILSDFIKSAESAGHKVFGSTILSNLDQNTTYLGTKGILASHTDPNASGGVLTELKWVELVANGDCEGDSNESLFWTVAQQGPSNATITSGAGKDGSKCIVLNATAKVSQAWDNQFFIKFSESLPNGTKYKLKMDIKAATAASGIASQAHANPSEYIAHGTFGTVDFTTDWKTYTNEGTIPSDGVQSIALNLNDFADANTYYFDNISFEAEVEREADPFYWENIVSNSDCEGESVESFFSTIAQAGPNSSTISSGVGKDGSRCVVVNATAKVANEWDNQFFIKFTEPLANGTKYKFTMDYKADVAASGIPTQSHSQPSAYIAHGTFGTLNFTTDWQTYTNEGTLGVDGCQSIAFNLNSFADANTYYFDNIVFEIEKEHVVGIPLTAKEKHDTVKYALDNYIKNVMEANKGYITSWDILGNMFTDNGALDTEEADNKFLWASYLNGPDMDGSNPNEYIQLAFKLTREYFAANGGNEADLKLFLNEEGLDKAAKLNGVTKQLTTWEQDKSVKFDGISTSITASYSEDASALNAEKKKVEDLFTALAKTGRLIRISGITLDYKDASDQAVSAKDMSVEQGKQMGTFYAFIVQKYKELIPANQQAGLYISNIFDNGDTPCGLWNQSNNSRKPQYGGFADGLQ
ncbi:MAG: endo-1,4-beta-xylanase [Bacteroidales bacterium]|nr:endo-1,4-beta-xylanase [Bacteroidales bacterium]